jgi:RNA polymerase sporulation-specific sigma factor
MTAEAEWIKQVKLYRDSDALNLLVQKYRPMIDNLYGQYFIEGFERSDWYQEAYSVCFVTCLNYDGSNGSKFGSFYKMRFTNHMIDLIRKENAAKRKANQQTTSIETVVRSGKLDKLKVPEDNSVELISEIKKVIPKFSHLELIGFQVELGGISAEAVRKKTKLEKQKLKRAIARCKSKLRKLEDQEEN